MKRPKLGIHQKEQFVEEFIRLFSTIYIQQTPFQYLEHRILPLDYKTVDPKFIEWEVKLSFKETNDSQPTHYSIYSLSFSRYPNVHDAFKDVVAFIKNGYHVQNQTRLNHNGSIPVHYSDEVKIQAWFAQQNK